MAGLLIGLDKHPGLQAVVMGETWRKMMAMCVIMVDEQEAN